MPVVGDTEVDAYNHAATESVSHLAGQCSYCVDRQQDYVFLCNHMPTLAQAIAAVERHQFL